MVSVKDSPETFIPCFLGGQLLNVREKESRRGRRKRGLELVRWKVVISEYSDLGAVSREDTDEFVHFFKVTRRLVDDNVERDDWRSNCNWMRFES